MKKILLFTLVLLAVFSLPVFAKSESDKTNYSEISLQKQKLMELGQTPTVAVYVFIDPSGVNKPLEAAEEVYKAIDTELFQNNALALPFEQTRKQLRTYIRENGIGDNVRESDKGFTPRKKDLQALANEAKADYVLFVNSRVTTGEVKFNIWTGQRKNLTILFDLVLMQNGGTDFLVDETYSEKGATSGSFERAYNRATKAVLSKIDLSSINFTKVNK